MVLEPVYLLRQARDLAGMAMWIGVATLVSQLER
jgi:hypothetical protein